MDQAPNPPSPDNGTPAARAGAVSPTLSTWDTYYKEASRRRRATGGGRQLRVAKRRRRLRERLGLGLSTLLVGGLVMIFYLVLR